MTVVLCLIVELGTTVRHGDAQRTRDALGGEEENEHQPDLQLFYSSGIENEHEIYSIAQSEARPSLTKDDVASGCGTEHKQPLIAATWKEQQQARQCQKKNNNYRAGDPNLKVQKPPKSVRIVDPPKDKARAENNRKGCGLDSVAIPLNSLVAPVGGFLASANRPRSVTDALFAAAPEAVVALTGPTPPAAESAEREDLLPKDMNKAFLQFAEVDPELTSKYIIFAMDRWPTEPSQIGRGGIMGRRKWCTYLVRRFLDF